MPEARRLTVGGLLLALALGVGTLLVVIQAQAQESTQAQEETTDRSASQPGPSSDGKERHCVANAVRVGSEDNSQMSCFETFRKAINVATGGRIQDAPNDPSELARNEAFRERLFASQKQNGEAAGTSSSEVNSTGTISFSSGLILSVEYEHADFRGSTLTNRAGRGCDNDYGIEWQLSNVGSEWNDRISSYIASNRCQVKHFENANFGGLATDWRGSDNYMGAMNDETTSLRWR